MPFGCFGKRKKKEKSFGEDGAKDASVGAAGAVTAPFDPSSAPKTEANVVDASESVVATRTHGLHASAAPATGHIQKSATLARYDFLRKSDYVNSADRWAALKEQYLSPKMTQSQHGAHLVPPPATNGPTPRGPVRVAQSLPRQFSPPSTVVSAVKFSQWFYERQVKEEEARREAHDREEKNRTDHSDLEHPDAQVEDAAIKIQAGFRGYKTRKHLEEARHHADDDNHENAGHPNEPISDQHKEKPHDQHHDEQHLVDDLDESDPRLNAAATKIQAGFKGMQARKEVREIRKHKEEDEHHDEPQAEDGDQHGNEHQRNELQDDGHNENDHHDDEHHSVEHSTKEMNSAAAKIQAGFKGYKTRKEMGKLHNHPSEQHPEQQHHEAEEHGEGALS